MSEEQSGRPQIISDEEKKKIWEEKKINSERTMIDLHVNLYPFVSKITFRNAVREGHERKWKKKKRPLLLPAHAAAHLKWVF